MAAGATGTTVDLATFVPRGSLPFVGRERERAVLGAAVAPVRMGFGTLVELIGEPGIGKSRLAEELREKCADMAIFGTRCAQYEASTPYFPFRSMLRSLLDVELNGSGEHNRRVLAARLAELDEELVPWAPLLAAPLDVEVESTPEVDDLDPAFWRARLHGVVGKLLGVLLHSPTLLLFEDVHWMDDASSELLRFLGTQLPTRPWLACTTRRPVEGGFAAAEGTPPLPALTLRLEPIPEEDARALVRAAAGVRRLSDQQLEAMIERGAGNPLFLQELASSEQTSKAEELPETVQALVAARIDRLSPGDRALLRWASVLGVSFSGALIIEVLEGDATVAAASEAWGRLEEFVEKDPDAAGAFRFRHALTRDAAYEGLSFKRRRDLHGRVAEVIERREGEDAVELLSLHSHHAERWPETWRYSILAAERAWEKHANAEAARFFERALEVHKRVPDLPAEEVARVWEALGDARIRAGTYERGMAARATSTTVDLAAFVPRLTLEWLRDHPDRLWSEVDGTLAFVDISGFTAMSERLSSLGKVGAEEVTDVMNATFAALLQVAYAEGGGLLKFGGDALLLLYDGEHHARRAARAAFGMRRVLRAIGRPRTSVGPTQLRMHAGIHSGRFQFFLVGESHRELLVTGPAATRTVEMEAASEAGEILLSPESAALLETAVLGEEKGPGFLLQKEPTTSGDAAPFPDVAGIPLEIAVPAPLRAQLLEVGPLEGEHRMGAVAFVRYSGVDEVIQSEGPEAVADGLDALVRAIQAAADEHQVTFLESDVDRDGGRFVLVAGAPQTFGDNEERLLRALRTAVDAGLPFPVHIGVSRGRVFTGQVGASFRRTYTLLGDTAALAARLMARAGEDAIWVAAEAYARGGRQFTATELEPFRVKGKSEPVEAFVLGELQAAPVVLAPEESGPSGGLPFVGRERERAVLGAAVAPVRMGFGTLVELIGEPGIGKSRLAEELREKCADMAIFGTRCAQYEASTPYFPFRSMLRSLLDVELNGSGEHNRRVLAARLAELDEELVPWAPLLAAPLDVEVESTPEVDDLDPAFWRARLHGVVGKLLGVLLHSPTLLLFEDVHWMDDASSELLRFLGTQLPTRPWLACTTRRPVEGGFAAAEGTPPLPALTLRLEPIPEEDARALVRAAAGVRRLSDQQLEAMIERGAGNPLFLQELASSEQTSKAEELPETVQALVAARIDRLSPGDRALLRWASVLGVSFSGALIIEVLEGDATVAAASEAWGRLEEFVEKDPDAAGAFRFRHALTRDAAYEGLSFKRRRDLHGRVAEVIERREGEDAVELLSLHSHHAERWPETWRYSILAAERAWEKHANAEAARFFERALEVHKRVPDLPAEEVARVWEALGDARIRAGTYEHAGEAFRAARKASPRDLVEQARLMKKDAVALLRMGRYTQALRRLSQALRRLEGLDSQPAIAERARLLSSYAHVLRSQRRPAETIRWCEAAITEAETSRALDALAQAYSTLDRAYIALGRLGEAVYSARAVTILEDLGDLDQLALALNNLGAKAYLEGRWNDALDHVTRARDVWTKVGDDTSASMADFNSAEMLSNQGRWDEAEPLLDRVLHMQQQAQNLLHVALATKSLGRLAARKGRFDEAASLLEEARALFESEHDVVELLTTDAHIVELHVLRGDPADALALAADVLANAESMNGVTVQLAMLHRLRGWALIQSGELGAAPAALAEALRIVRSQVGNHGIESADYDTALTLDALAHLGRLSGESVEEFERERDEILDRLGVVGMFEPPLVQR